jgi:hypothetical protein
MEGHKTEFAKNWKTRKGLPCIQRAIACRMSLQYNLRQPLSGFFFKRGWIEKKDSE